MNDIIENKRDGKTLTKQEIRFFIRGYSAGEIPHEQMSALLMAIYFQGMSDEEQTHLTEEMVQSGETIDLSEISGVKVDKHSTGGVGDTTSIILSPLVASLEIPVAKMSGRGLGHTGGTLDKLEAIPGFQVEVTNEKFIQLVNKNKLAIISQSGNLTPADQKIYSLRDITATVNSIPLIASSIMSKKLAAGADAIVLDVKTGSGAFMAAFSDAKKLAEAMVSIGQLSGKETTAIISDMSQPLGNAIGNSLEIKEAIDTLKGEGPEDLTELCLILGSYMVAKSDSEISTEAAYQKLKENLTNGKALKKFKVMVEAQGGNSEIIADPTLLPQAKYIFDVKAKKSGRIGKMITHELGRAASLLGAGRTTQDAEIDLAVGILLHKKIGDFIKVNEPIATIYANQAEVSQVEEMIKKNIIITENEVSPPPLIYETIKSPTA